MVNSSLKVAVLMGGTSSEREISLVTGGKILSALKGSGYQAYAVDAGLETAAALAMKRPDVAFIALHGSPGEDGTIQGLLEIMDVPYVGSGVLASALGMDKERSKIFFAAAGIPAPFYLPLGVRELEIKGIGRAVQQVVDTLGLPAVVKPTKEGSAIGVSIARQREEVSSALTEAASKGWDVIVEEYVKGREITIGLLGNEDLLVLPIVEIVPENDFYDYEAKYDGKSRHIVPAILDAEVAEAATKYALAAHRSLGCRGMSRVDFVISEQDRIPYILEINTIPGMTPTSLFPEAAKAAGISFEELVGRLVELALEGREVLKTSSP